MILIYRILTTLIYPLLFIFIYCRKILKKEDSIRFKEKILISHFNVNRKKDSKLIWFHAASIGELKSIIPIIELLNKNDVDIIQLRKEIEEYIKNHAPILPKNSGIEIVPTVGFERVLQRSVYEAQLIKKPTVYAIDILTSIFSENDSYVVYKVRPNFRTAT